MFMKANTTRSKFFIVALIASFLFASIPATMYALADEVDTAYDIDSSQGYSSLEGVTISTENLETIFETIVQQIQENLGDIYRMSNFHYSFAERVEDGILLVDINIYYDVTLLEHPRYSAFMQGMQEVIASTRNIAERDAIQSTLDILMHDASEMYYGSLTVTELYTVAFGNPFEARARNAGNFEMFHRDVTPNEVFLVPVETVAELRAQSSSRNDDEVAFLDGIRVAEQIAAESADQPLSRNARINFRRLDARDWAQIHYRCNANRCGNATGRRCTYFLPQIVPGTNCANFVSWALRQGGLPTSSNATTGWHNGTATSWPSNSWMRTGFSARPSSGAPNGVTHYVRDRNWFNAATTDIRVVSAGSIMFWTNTSHVALVTSGNQQHVYFAENGQPSSGSSNAFSRHRRFDPNVIAARFYTLNQQTLNLLQ